MVQARREAATDPSDRLICAILLTGLLVWAVGCASSGAPEAESPRAMSVSESFASAPAWVTEGCRAYWTNPEKRRQVVCGLGSAPSMRNRVAARETAIARARTSVARSLEVTIESLVRLEERGDSDPELETIVHQLSSTSLRGLQLESVWRSPRDEVHALVSLDLDRVQKTVRSSQALTAAAREDLAQRAADAFAALDAAFAATERGAEDGQDEARR